ncbi:MAG: XrtA/PEP-CTERM system-associated ATPase [Pseudomonadota bacterium]
MYDDHYGLSGRPFQLTPDPKFWFDTATHRKAMAYLGYGLSQGEGFVVITGDPGAGKTTLMGHLLEQIDRERMNVIKIVSTQLKPEDLLRLVSAGLGIDAGEASKAAMLAAIEKGLHAVARSGRRTLLVVDEAQSLPIESLEELRMLSNFQAGGYPLLQIFLLGQPEFRVQLQDRRLEQLRQRVIAMHHLDAMDADEVEPYLIHRLSCVGWRGKPRFTNDAIDAMYRWSGGSPRRLNQLASRVLLFGAIEQIDSFTDHDVAAVVADLNDDVPESQLGAAREPFELREVAPLPIGSPSPPPMGEPRPLRADAPAQGDPGLTRRIAELEAHLKDQDEALRRVLSLLVDWVESDGRRPDLSALRGNAA